MFLVFLYCFAVLVPLLILFHCFKTLDKRIRNCRIKYAIMSMISIVFDAVLVWLILTEKIAPGEGSVITVYGPFVLCALSFLFSLLGKKKEAKIEADMLAENAIDIMDIRGQSKPKYTIKG